MKKYKQNNLDKEIFIHKKWNYQVLKTFPNKILEYKKGNKDVLKFFLEKVYLLSERKADIDLSERLLILKLR